MTPLSEVAEDVAAALGLSLETRLDRAKYVSGLSNTDGVLGLYANGSNLSDPYWRCRCEDWLIANGWRFSCADSCEAWRFDENDQIMQIDLDGPWPEAPARLVSAVWRARK